MFGLYTTTAQSHRRAERAMSMVEAVSQTIHKTPFCHRNSSTFLTLQETPRHSNHYCDHQDVELDGDDEMVETFGPSQ